MNHRSIIVLEANEIPFKVFDYFCNLYPNSSLAGVLQGSRQYRTHAEDKARFLAPWTTWPSFHRGVNDEMHRIFRFGQWETSSNDEFPALWTILARNGISTGVFSSMQSSPLPENSADYAFYFPDMFSNEAATEPADLEVLQEFNLVMTRESARNVSRRIDVKSGASLVLNSNRLGIRLNTYVDIAKQLFNEVIDPAAKIRRRAYQPLLMLDVYCKKLAQTRPRFSTFFTNHVAAAMHRYWAAAFPEDYETLSLDPAWVEKYKGEVEFAMLKLDKMVGRLAQFVRSNSDYILVIATSMGQAAIPASHVSEFLTITDTRKFLEALGVAAGEYEERNAMIPDFSFRILADKANTFEKELRSLVIGGKALEFERDQCFFHVCGYDERPGIKQAQLHGRSVALADLGMGYLVHEDEVACTAHHVPEGSLIVYSPHADTRPGGDRVDVSALDFAPAVLEHFGLARPSYMRRNASLLANC